jgi:hypothetical protein
MHYTFVGFSRFPTNLGQVTELCIYFGFYFATPFRIMLCTHNCRLLSTCQERPAGSGVGMNSYAVLFYKTCVHP